MRAHHRRLLAQAHNRGYLYQSALIDPWARLTRYTQSGHKALAFTTVRGPNHLSDGLRSAEVYGVAADSGSSRKAMSRHEWHLGRLAGGPRATGAPQGMNFSCKSRVSVGGVIHASKRMDLAATAHQ